MALKKLLKRAVTKAAGKVAAKKAAAKTTAAAKKAALVAKSKKVAAAKKAGTLQKPSTRKRPQLSEAAKERQRISAGQRKPATKAKSKIKVAPTKRTSTVKSKVSLSKTAERRQNRRSSSGKSPATGDKTKIAKLREAQKDSVGTSKRQAAIKANKSTSKKSYTSTETKVSAKTKDADARKSKVVEKTSSLPKSEKVRLAKSALRDRGAKHVVSKTPKSSTATAKAAGKPRQSQKDYSAGSRGPIYGPKTPKPKATNASQVDKGRVERNAQAEGRKAVAKFNVEARLTKMKAATSNARMPNLTAAERQKLRRQKTKEINAKAQRVRELSERKSARQQAARKNNVSPSAAMQRQKDLGNRDWRNRLTDSKAKGLSENMTQRTSGKKVRTQGELVQTPKGRGVARQTPKSPVTAADKARRKANVAGRDARSFNPRGRGARQETGKLKAAGGSKKTTIKRDNGPFRETVVSRPTATKSAVGMEYKPQRADVRGSNTKRGMDELPIGKKSLPVKSSSKTSASPSTKQSAGYKAREARETKATESLRIRNQTKPKQTAAQKAHNAKRDKERPRLTTRENSARIRKSLRETRNVSAESRTKAQRAQNQSVPKELDNRSKAQRDAARKLAPKTYEDYGKGTTTWSN